MSGPGSFSVILSHLLATGIKYVDAYALSDYNPKNSGSFNLPFSFFTMEAQGLPQRSCAVPEEAQRLDIMANTSSARKAVRKIAARTRVNKARRSRVRTFLRRVEEAIAAGDRKTAADALRAAQPEIQRAATRGVLHRRTASRKVSRLSRRVNSMDA